MVSINNYLSKVMVDGNHSLAGQTLNFSCIVTGVHTGTEEEIALGHMLREDERFCSL